MNTLCEIRVHLLGHDRLDAAELRRAGDVGVELEGFAQQRAVFERDLRREGLGEGVRGRAGWGWCSSEVNHSRPNYAGEFIDWPCSAGPWPHGKGHHFIDGDGD